MKRIEEPQSPAQMAAISPDEQSLLIAQRDYDAAISTLAKSALVLGDHETARLAGEKAGRSDEIATVLNAIDRDDDERCACPLPPLNAQKIQPPKYLDVGGTPYWSEKHGAFVKLYRCYQCGDTQALPDAPTTIS